MKYMGSKSKIAKYILPYIHSYILCNNIELYIEPFIGGANMIDKVECKHKVGSDINKHLVALLNHVKDTTDDLPEDVDYELYQDVKANQESGKYEDWYIGAVEFLAGFNGRGFEASFAKPVYEEKADGSKSYRNYYQEAKRNLIEQAPLLKDIDITCNNYDVYGDVKDALIYCDPPYENTKTYSRKNPFDHSKFWDWVRKMSKNNIVLVSEENAPDDFEVLWEQEVTRTIRANEKSTSTEKLFIIKSEEQDDLDF